MEYFQPIVPLRQVIAAVYIFILNFIILTNETYQIDPDGIGWITPRGCKIIRPNEPVQIFCTINLENTGMKNNNFTSENLEFQRDGYILDSHNVTKVNETTISLYLWNENESQHVYECFLSGNGTQIWSLMELQDIRTNDRGTGSDLPNNGQKPSTILERGDKLLTSMGFIQLVVTEKPEEVWNFRCVVYDWNRLECFYNRLKDYRKTTGYVVKYKPVISTVTEIYGTWINITFHQLIKCSNDDPTNDYCLWMSRVQLPGSHMNQKLKIVILTGVNMLGQFILDPTWHTRPNAITHSLYERTSNSITLGCTFHDNLDDALAYRFIDVKFNYFTSSNRPIFLHTFKVLSSEEACLIVVDKLFPNRQYDIDIRVRLSDEAPVFGEYWSDYEKAEFRTRPLAITYVPETDASLFRVEDINEHSRVVHIYWKPFVGLLTRDYGDFHYQVKYFSVDGKGKQELERDWYNVFTPAAAIVRIGFSAYHFVLRSVNSEGTSNTSFINVPAANDTVKPRAFFYTIQRRYFNNSFTFECIWLPPKAQPDVVDYTLFWFEDATNKNGFRFTRRIYWIHLPDNVTRHQISFSFKENISDSIVKNDIFCCLVSVNTKNSSSGLHWDMQYVISISDEWHTKLFSPLKNEPVPIKKDESSKRQNYKPFRFSPSQFQKWMAKLGGNDL